MDYIKKESTNYRQLMDEYKIGSLMAKIIDVANWPKEVIEDVLTQPTLESIQNDEILIKIHSRILQAKDNKEKVFVAGDYDADGLCGTAILVRLLNQLAIKNGYYIPNRFKEGYGLSLERTKEAISKGYTLIITVDNGIKAKEALDYCKEKSIDVIILDHHKLEEKVDCFALFHPEIVQGKRSWLCGAGCAFEVVRCFEVDLAEYLVLAMCATIGDMMSLRGENRYIVVKGLEALNNGSGKAIRKLCKDTLCNETTIGYQVVPKLNAVGRLADKYNVNKVVKFLTTDKVTDIDYLTKQLFDINELRKEMTATMTKEIIPQAYNKNFAVIYQAEFHPGLIGLVANKISKEQNIPVMVACENEGKVLGSIRAPEGIDLMECLKPISHYFISYGGHAQAAGISFNKEDLPRIEKYFENYSYVPTNKQEIAVEVSLDDCYDDNCAEVLAHGPYGEGVKLPALYLLNPKIINYRSLSKPNYMKWGFNGFSAVWFSFSHTYDEYVNVQLDFIGELSKNVYLGKIDYLIKVLDVKRMSER